MAASEHFVNSRIYTDELYLEQPIKHRRFTWVRKFSQDALKELSVQLGPWDMFIHDSDHSYETQHFEYEAAWNYVRSGGIIASDDTTWGTPPHRAWQQFLERHGIRGANKMGNAEWFRRP